MTIVYFTATAENSLASLSRWPCDCHTRFGNAIHLCSHVPLTEQQAADALTDLPTSNSFAGEQHILGSAATER